MRFSPPLQVLEREPGGEVSESPKDVTEIALRLLCHPGLNSQKCGIGSNALCYDTAFSTVSNLRGSLRCLTANDN